MAQPSSSGTSNARTRHARNRADVLFDYNLEHMMQKQVVVGGVIDLVFKSDADLESIRRIYIEHVRGLDDSVSIMNRYFRLKKELMNKENIPEDSGANENQELNPCEVGNLLLEEFRKLRTITSRMRAEFYEISDKKQLTNNAMTALLKKYTLVREKSRDIEFYCKDVLGETKAKIYDACVLAIRLKLPTEDVTRSQAKCVEMTNEMDIVFEKAMKLHYSVSKIFDNTENLQINVDEDCEIPEQNQALFNRIMASRAKVYQVFEKVSNGTDTTRRKMDQILMCGDALIILSVFLCYNEFISKEVRRSHVQIFKKYHTIQELEKKIRVTTLFNEKAEIELEEMRRIERKIDAEIATQNLAELDAERRLLEILSKGFD